MNASKISAFKTLTGHDPYPHQKETYEALARGESVILRAPTGSGKSEAVFVPFVELRGRILPNRMIYSLPMRALVNSLHERFKGYGPGLDVRAQHGKRPESVLFDAAYLKCQTMGPEVVVPVTGGHLDFEPWEQIMYGKFGGHRRKRVFVRLLGNTLKRR